jgi:hypothetical protein
MNYVKAKMMIPALLVLNIIYSSTIQDFQHKYFEWPSFNSGIYEVDVGFSSNDKDGNVPLLFVDMNGDR